MIIVTGVIELDPEDVWPAMTAAARMVAATEEEPGCLTYRFYQDISNQQRFRVYEEWADEAALKAHFAAPHMAEFRSKLKKLRVIERKIVKFEPGERTPL